MNIVKQLRPEHKPTAIQSCVNELQTIVLSAAREGKPVHELERDLFAGILRLGYHLQEQFFELLGDGDQGECLEVEPGRCVKRLPGHHVRGYQSVFGEYQLPRVVYGRREGQRIECVPLDTRLGLPPSKFSYLLQEWDQALAVETPFGQVNEVLLRMLGLKQSVASLEAMNRAMAAPVESFWDVQPPPPVEAEGHYLVVSGDGKGVPMRKPATEPSIMGHDLQQGPKPEGKKMAVVGAVYSIEAYPRTPEQVLANLFREPSEAVADSDSPRPKPLAKAVRASLSRGEGESARRASPEIFDWLGAQVQGRDPDQQQPLVVLMDGQTSLWDEAERVFGQRGGIEILDLLHVTSRLWKALPLFYNQRDQTAMHALKLWMLLVLTGRVEWLLIWFEYLVEQTGLSPAKRQELDKITHYLRHNQHRMRYDQYLAQGLPIASGVIEGACRHVVKDRLERAGMRWTVPGAQALLNLRCVALNGQWDEFTQYRIQRETERLYPYAPVIGQAEWPLQIAA